MIYANARFLTQDITGVQRFGIEISRNLKKMMGNDICFVSPNNTKHPELVKELDVQFVGNKSGYYWEQIELPNFLKKQGKPLLVNFASTAPIAYSNQISTVHDAAYLRFPEGFSKAFYWTYKLLIPMVCKKSRAVVTVSEFSKKEISLMMGVPLNKLFVVYNAVDCQKFQPIVNSSEKGNYFLCVSSVSYRKNLKLVLEAFALKQDVFKNTKLYIIGELKGKSFNNEDLENYLSLPNVKLLGRVSDNELINYYRNSIAFIYPSFYEGFGIPPLEAQACGCPVIVAKTSALPEVFEESALYCDPYDANDLGNKMEKLKDDLISSNHFKEMGITNSQRFTWEQNAFDFFEVIKKFN